MEKSTNKITKTVNNIRSKSQNAETCLLCHILFDISCFFMNV
ncbi:hypothetical protein Runsl_5784 (plasmid) [Runella slithyformis DSM 19594]|uniref:Uncharacterized protein n=1 Tax=Runella slithyformis (strain ATCC 29530 / DSM 19594 / LMG 11500 / NCIMB 11436 / LSU 4) TaxID=761193 RepID=A0A7U4E972_RUNSL|nr:hypothetical protein Runsl_5784 [Runella slithyformis DSM 19594]